MALTYPAFFRQTMVSIIDEVTNSGLVACPQPPTSGAAPTPASQAESKLSLTRHLHFLVKHFPLSVQELTTATPHTKTYSHPSFHKLF